MTVRATGESESGPDRPRVIVLSPTIPAGFIRRDCEHLGHSFDADLCMWRGLRDLRSLWREVAGADALVVWFAGRHALPGVVLARRCRKPIAIVVGGWEVAWVPEVRYGIPPRSLRQKVLRAVLKSADVLLPVSDATLKGTLKLVPEMADRTRRIYHAIDPDRFRPDPAAPRRGVLTVAHFSREAIAVKGLRLYKDTAALMPECDFVAAGPVMDSAGKEFFAECPANLRWVGPLAGSELVRQFQVASVYFQGSLHESFSVATAEAMACGCIPVVSRRGALPEVVGDTGVYLDSLTSEAAVAAIRTALSMPESGRTAARRRVIDCFSLIRRRDELCNAVQDILRTRQKTR